VLPLPFVFLGKNLFEPSRLSLRRILVRRCGVMKDDELLAAAVTPKRTHLLESGCPHSRLTLFERHCFHRLIFYLPVRSAFSPLGLRFATETRLYSSGNVSQLEQIVHGMAEILLAAKITLCRLNRGVAHQKLNLLDLAAARMAQLRAGPAQVVGRNVLKTSVLAASLNHVPDHILRDAVAPYLVGSSDSAEDSSLGDSCLCCPIVERGLDSERNRHSTDVPAYPNQVHDGPVALA
jgi:hypothetical protein